MPNESGYFKLTVIRKIKNCNLEKDRYMYMHIYIYIYDRITLLYSRNYQNLVNQLYFNKTLKILFFHLVENRYLLIVSCHRKEKALQIPTIKKQFKGNVKSKRTELFFFLAIPWHMEFPSQG